MVLPAVGPVNYSNMGQEIAFKSGVWVETRSPPQRTTLEHAGHRSNTAPLKHGPKSRYCSTQIPLHSNTARALDLFLSCVRSLPFSLSLVRACALSFNTSVFHARSLSPNPLKLCPRRVPVLACALSLERMQTLVYRRVPVPRDGLAQREIIY